MSVSSSQLSDSLANIAAATPAPIASAFDAAVGELAVSGDAAGLEVDDRAPDFALPDQLGRTVSLSDRLADGPVALVFYRGDWCPYCNLTLHALQAELESLRKLGADLIAISPQAPDHALTLAEKHGLGFSVLSDLVQQTIAAYRLRYTLPPQLQELYLNQFVNDLRQQNADGSWNLPVPGTFLIDRDGIIRARFVDADYRRRTEPADLLEAIRELGGGARQ